MCISVLIASFVRTSFFMDDVETMCRAARISNERGPVPDVAVSSNLTGNNLPVVQRSTKRLRP